MDELLRSLALFQPEVALTAGLLLVVLVDSTGAAWRGAAMRTLTLSPWRWRWASPSTSGHGAPGAAVLGDARVDPVGAAFKVILVAAVLLVVLAFRFDNSKELHGLGQGEFLALVLALALASMLLAAADDS